MSSMGHEEIESLGYQRPQEEQEDHMTSISEIYEGPPASS